MYKYIVIIASLTLPCFAAYKYLEFYRLKQSQEIYQENVLALFEHQKFYEPRLFKEREEGYDVSAAERGNSFESLVTMGTVYSSEAVAHDLERYEKLYLNCLVGAWSYRKADLEDPNALPSLKAKIYELYCVPEETNVYVALLKSYKEVLPHTGNSVLKTRVERNIFDLKKESFSMIYEMYVEPHDQKRHDLAPDEEFQL